MTLFGFLYDLINDFPLDAFSGTGETSLKCFSYGFIEE